jgi:uncharacterized protein
MGGVAVGQAQLANQLAYLLPLEPGQKLQVLQQDDPGARLTQLQLLLEQLQGESGG